MSSIGALLGPHSSYLVTLIDQYSGGFPYAHIRTSGTIVGILFSQIIVFKSTILVYFLVNMYIIHATGI